MRAAVHHGDCLEVIPRLVADGVVCDAVVTDAPYHLVSVARGQTGGFMGQQWDGGDIAFRPETWAAIATILRPGGFLVAFGGTRTYHRLVCAIEDAGFVIQDQIAWMFGSGFPKGRDMLKPAFEPICLAYKPGGKRTMQVDECRVGTDESTVRPAGINTAVYGADNRHGMLRGSVDGRWPANVAHDGSDEVLAAFPESNNGGGKSDRFGEIAAARRYKARGATDFAQLPGNRRTDAGSAARFFYCAKANKQDRWGSRHPTVKPIDLIRWLVRLVTPPGGLVLDPFAGSGTTGAAAFAERRGSLMIERENQYVADILERMAWCEGDGMHSTAAKARRIDDKPLGGLFEVLK